MSPNKSPPSAVGIIRQFLLEHGFDGLICGKKCNCPLDELLSCLNMLDCCRPGFTNPNKQATMANRLILTDPHTKPRKKKKP